MFRGDSNADASSPIIHFSLEVDDIDTLRDQLVRRGIAVSEKNLGSDNSWQCHCTDPNGISIEFHQYTPASLQLTGGIAEVNW